MPAKGSQISILAARSIKFPTFMFKTMEHCFNSRAVLEYQHQWDLEQKKTDKPEMLRVDKSNWARTIEAIMLHLKVVGIPLAYVVGQHVKVVYILPGYDANLNLDEEMITKALIVDAKSNVRTTQDSLDRAHIS